MSSHIAGKLCDMYDKYLDISNDVVFKRVFGKRANKGLLISVLNEIIHELNIVDLNYLTPEITGFSRENKNSRMDLRIKTDTGYEVIIEMQVADQHDFKDRAVYYSALPILEEVQSGQLLYSLTPRYTVSILMFSLDHETDSEKCNGKVAGDEMRFSLNKQQKCEYVQHHRDDIQNHWSTEFRARYSLREQVTHEKLSEAINLVFIELGRFNKSIESLENDKERFYFCIKHMRQFQSMPEEFRGNDLMENLFRTAEVESLSAKEQKQYLSYMTTERDLINQREFALEKATNAGFAKGLAEGEARGEARGKAIGEAEGLALGLNRGIAEGKQQRGIEIAKAMKDQGLDFNVITQCTGLPIDEIKNL